MSKPRAPRITLYSGPGCPHCRRLRDYLKAQHLKFQEFDISRNARARLEFERLGGRGVPLLKLGDQLLAGFDPKRLKQALNRAGLASRDQ